METAEKQHAKRIEQTLASINKNLERIARSLEKMEPTVYKLPKFDIPLNDPGINEPAPDQYLTTITAKDPVIVENPAENDSKPRYCHDAGVTFMYWSNPKGERKWD